MSTVWKDNRAWEKVEGKQIVHGNRMEGEHGNRMEGEQNMRQNGRGNRTWE